MAQILVVALILLWTSLPGCRQAPAPDVHNAVTGHVDRGLHTIEKAQTVTAAENARIGLQNQKTQQGEDQE